MLSKTSLFHLLLWCYIGYDWKYAACGVVMYVHVGLK